MSIKFHVKICPVCGSEDSRGVVRDVARNYAGQTYTVPDLSFYECPDCGERIYGRDAMRKIEAHSPAYSKTETLVYA